MSVPDDQQNGSIYYSESASFEFDSKNDSTAVQLLLHSYRFEVTYPKFNHYMLNVEQDTASVYKLLCCTLERDREHGGDGSFGFLDIVKCLFHLQAAQRTAVITINDQPLTIVGGLEYSDFSTAIRILNNLLSWGQVRLGSIKLTSMGSIERESFVSLTVNS
jgi:hypothetical protein